MTALYVMVAVGTLLSGVAALGQLVTRWHLQHLRKEINGRMDQQLSLTRKVARAEGVASVTTESGEPLSGEANA